MQGKVHVAIGAGCLAVLCLKHPAGFTLADNVFIIPEIGMFTAAAGSLLPDIDMHSTSMGRKHKITSKVVNKVGGGHRGITHTLLFPVLLVLATLSVMNFLAGYFWLQTISSSLFFGFTFGYVMHIFADLFNGKGCPILWPISRSKVSIADLPSKGWVPWVFAFVVIGLFAILIFGGNIL